MFLQDPAEFALLSRHFEQVLLDSSSYIVLKDIGALEVASKAWRFCTIQEVHREIGYITVPVLIIPTVEAEEGIPVDQLLLETARETGIPLLSEDRKLLEAAGNTGLACFDALSAIEVLREKLKNPDIPDAYTRWKRRILHRNRYRPDRLEWAEGLAQSLAANANGNPLPSG